MSDIKTFNTVSALKYWCYKILPLVYDDSLSYYEVLCRVTKKLNEVIDNTNNIPEIISEAVANGGFLDNLQEQIAELNDKDSKTATADRNTGELIWLNGELFRITRPMLAGDQYIESSEGVTGNIEKVTMEEWINRFLGYVKDAIAVEDQKYNVIASKAIINGTLLWWKGNLYRAKKDIVLNEYLSTDVNLEGVNLEQIIKDIDTRLSDDIAQETTTRENADTALDERITQETTARENADTALDERITERITQETTARENADTEINNNINAINRQIKNLHGKFTNTKVVTIGDSYGRGFYSNSEHINEGWPAQLKSITGLNIIDYSYGGAGFVGNSTGTGHQFLDQLQTAVSDGNNDAELLIISGGSNDCNATGLIVAINQALNYAVNNFINAKIMVIWNSVNYIYTLGQKNSTIMTYNEGCMNNNVPFYNVSPYVRFVYNTVAEDKLHLNAKGYKIIAQEIAALIYVGSFFTYNFNIVVLEDIILHGNPDKVCFTKYNVNPAGKTIPINTGTLLEGTTEFTYAQVSNSLYPNLFTGGEKFIVAGANCFLGYSATAGAQKVFRPSQTNVILRDNSLIITPATLDNNGTGYFYADNNSEIQVNLNAFTANIPGSYFC